MSEITSITVVVPVTNLTDEIATLRAKLAAAVARAERLADLLGDIGDRAHDASSGPAVPDALWEIRDMAYEGVRADGAALAEGGCGMTDRELLELAAKAAGINIKMDRTDADDQFIGFVVGARNTNQKSAWNPLIDDGDALRLVSTLGIHLQFATGFAVAYAGSVHAKQFTEHSGTDQHAATRRVIVRAAAAMGAAI